MGPALAPAAPPPRASEPCSPLRWPYRHVLAPPDGPRKPPRRVRSDPRCHGPPGPRSAAEARSVEGLPAGGALPCPSTGGSSDSGPRARRPPPNRPMLRGNFFRAGRFDNARRHPHARPINSKETLIALWAEEGAQVPTQQSSLIAGSLLRGSGCSTRVLGGSSEL